MHTVCAEFLEHSGDNLIGPIIYIYVFFFFNFWHARRTIGEVVMNVSGVVAFRSQQQIVERIILDASDISSSILTICCFV